MSETPQSGRTAEYVECPECRGTKTVWAAYAGGEVEGACPYCGGSGRARASAVRRDYPPQDTAEPHACAVQTCPAYRTGHLSDCVSPKSAEIADV